MTALLGLLILYYYKNMLIFLAICIPLLYSILPILERLLLMQVTTHNLSAITQYNVSSICFKELEPEEVWGIHWYNLIPK
jgi:hypothetical protein